MRFNEFYSTVDQIISMMSEDNFQDASQEMNGLPAVVLGDEDLPRLYEDSEISMSQLPRQYGNSLNFFYFASISTFYHLFSFLIFESLFFMIIIIIYNI